MTRRFSSDFWSARSAGRPSASLLCAARPQPADAAPCEAFRGRDDTACELRTLDQASSPATLFVPEHYEPNYAYPLLVWFHAEGGSERDLGTLMPRISTRNYFGLALRSTAAGPGAAWSLAEPALPEVEEDLLATVRRLRREYHLHTERTILAGFGAGATMALRLMLSRPEWFGGAVALAGRFPESPQPLRRFRDLGRKRVLIGAGARDRTAPVADAVRSGRLLHAAGLTISTRVYDAAHELTPRMLTHVNEWVMEGIHRAGHEPVSR